MTEPARPTPEALRQAEYERDVARLNYAAVAKSLAAAEQRVRALEAALHAAQEYVRFLAEHHEAPRVSPGLTPTYAINLSRLTAAIAALAR